MSTKTTYTDYQLQQVLSALQSNVKVLEVIGSERGRTLFKSLNLNSSTCGQEEFGLDSLEVVEFVMAIEEVFNVEIPDDSFGLLDGKDKKAVPVRSLLEELATRIGSVHGHDTGILAPQQVVEAAKERDEASKKLQEGFAPALDSFRASYPDSLVLVVPAALLADSLKLTDPRAIEVLKDINREIYTDPNKVLSLINLPIYSRFFDLHLEEKAKVIPVVDNGWVSYGGKFRVVPFLERHAQAAPFLSGLPEAYSASNGWTQNPQVELLKFVPPSMAMIIEPDSTPIASTLEGRFIILAKKQDGKMVVSNLEWMDEHLQQSFLSA